MSMCVTNVSMRLIQWHAGMTDIHTYYISRTFVLLMWGSLRIAPIRSPWVHFNCPNTFYLDRVHHLDELIDFTRTHNCAWPPCFPQLEKGSLFHKLVCYYPSCVVINQTA